MELTLSEKVIAYLGLGSNLGDRVRNLKQGIKLLSQNMTVVGISPLYETAPLGNTAQPHFLNMVCAINTSLSPIQLLALAKKLEIQMGRIPGPPNSPRPLDIDILFYDGQRLDTPTLKIPHPGISERAFVLVPLADIAPDFVHPISGKTVRELLGELKRDPLDVVRWEEK
jgi:2-amino-4-hydroxy-6-hydroxymethyldihydropteridine diphosphokinase